MEKFTCAVVVLKSQIKLICSIPRLGSEHSDQKEGTIQIRRERMLHPPNDIPPLEARKFLATLDFMKRLCSEFFILCHLRQSKRVLATPQPRQNIPSSIMRQAKTLFIRYVNRELNSGFSPALSQWGLEWILLLISF